MNTLLALLLLAAPPSFTGAAFSPRLEPDRSPAALTRRVEALSPGLTHLMLVAEWAQERPTSSTLRPFLTGNTDQELRLVGQTAARLGLRRVVLPLVKVAKARREALAPVDPEMFWESYQEFIFHYADLARELEAEALVVGSGLSSLEGERARWAQLLTGVRSRFSGQLIYQAAWGHHGQVTFWDQVDWVGSAFPRALREPQAQLALLGSFSEELLRLKRLSGKPLVLLEAPPGVTALPGVYAVFTWPQLKGGR